MSKVGPRQVPQKAKQIPQKAKQVSRQAGRAAQQAAPGGFKGTLKDQDTLANLGTGALVAFAVLIAASVTSGCECDSALSSGFWKIQERGLPSDVFAPVWACKPIYALSASVV